VDKLEQMHKEYVGVIVGMLDQVYALYRAALGSGNQRIVEQITLFQINCRQIAERIGLVAFDGKRGEKFDSQLHLNVDRKTNQTPNATITGALAPGYTYQTKMLRQALVKVSPDGVQEQPQQTSKPPETQTAATPSSESKNQEPQLPGLSELQQNG
jgi:molecular chaperone GrpE (heat shock protein)